jgi:hypothetical protein
MFMVIAPETRQGNRARWPYPAAVADDTVLSTRFQSQGEGGCIKQFAQRKLRSIFPS